MLGWWCGFFWIVYRRSYSAFQPNLSHNALHGCSPAKILGCATLRVCLLRGSGAMGITFLSFLGWRAQIKELPLSPLPENVKGHRGNFFTWTGGRYYSNYTVNWATPAGIDMFWTLIKSVMRIGLLILRIWSYFRDFSVISGLWAFYNGAMWGNSGVMEKAIYIYLIRRC